MFVHKRKVVGRGKGRHRLKWKITVFPFCIQVGVGYPVIDIFKGFVISPKQVYPLGIAIATVGINSRVVKIIPIKYHQIPVVFIIGFYSEGAIISQPLIIQDVMVGLFRLKVIGYPHQVIVSGLLKLSVSH